MRTHTSVGLGTRSGDDDGVFVSFFFVTDGLTDGCGCLISPNMFILFFFSSNENCLL